MTDHAKEPVVPTQAEREQLVADAKAKKPRRKPTWLALRIVDHSEGVNPPITFVQVATGTTPNGLKKILHDDAIVGEIILVPIRHRLSITSAQTTFIKTLKL